MMLMRYNMFWSSSADHDVSILWQFSIADMNAIDYVLTITFWRHEQKYIILWLSCIDDVSRFMRIDAYNMVILLGISALLFSINL